MPEDAIAGLDPGIDTVTSESTPVDTSTTQTDTELEGQTPSDLPEGEGGEPAQPGEQDRVTSQKPVFDGKKIDPDVKAALDEIRAKNPVVAARMRNALLQGQELRNEIPGGVKEARQLRATAEQLEDRGGLEKIDADLANWDTVANMYLKGDTSSFVKDLVETDENAFRQLAPAVFEKFRDLDQTGYSAYVSQVLVADMRDQGVPVAMQLLGHFMAGIDNPTMKQAFESLSGYFNRVSELAKNPVISQKQAEQPDQRANELQTREKNLVRQEWTSTAVSKRREIYDSAMRSLVGNRQLTASESAEIKEFYGMKMQSFLRSDPKFNATLERYFAAGDQKGYLRYVESFDRKNVLEALKYAVGKAVPTKPGTPAPRTPATNGARSQAKTQALPGFELRNNRPEMSEIDLRHPQAREWMLQRKALLLNGKKVQWGG